MIKEKMNKLNISSSTYCEIEKQLGILTDEGLNGLLERLEEIAHNRENAGMVEYEGLLKITRLIGSFEIERDRSLGNMLIINNYNEINEIVFENQSSKKKIKLWLLKDMLMDVAEMIDEGFRYGLDDSYETDKLKDFLFYLTRLFIRFN